MSMAELFTLSCTSFVSIGMLCATFPRACAQLLRINACIKMHCQDTYNEFLDNVLRPLKFVALKSESRLWLLRKEAYVERNRSRVTELKCLRKVRRDPQDCCSERCSSESQTRLQYLLPTCSTLSITQRYNEIQQTQRQQCPELRKNGKIKRSLLSNGI